MQRIGIIGAMAQEVNILAGQLDNAERYEHAGFVFHTGTRHGLEVIILQSGIGKVNAAVGTAILLERHQPDAIINTGSAGGFATDLAIGDVIISDEVRHHDVDAVVFGYELGQVPGMPAAYHADSRLRDIARGAIAALGEVNVREGMIATGDAFMADPERVATTRAQFPTMLAVEMEGAAIAQTCYLYDCPFVVIRALSDIPGSGDNHLSFEQFLDIAADHSSRMVDQMLIALGETK
ncbi:MULTISPECIES: 5'-methylthioadenosine/S-adenosylhomocysteine nucleosidase [Halomonadaceae]|uniref:5'-methylthioadenosine/S-adenosylhomocysteine nucleosidase n=2 Tax=Vreelandella TaxID=3137766 RepID=A0A0D7UU47_9GAMM|nr:MULTISPECIES: 5'-methylthioadenosine/S-adenosylhomocysteine nucleosidase [Halomonas]MCO7242160.1 5'-methylthioadenosine/S-adenosylhomocysteine nucleosidase [Halomonas sp. Ps84H-12]MCP1303775.1 5'-methylthioadenosine/S-adenosylhomocysteine nucleosidase [Halomonas sp. R1t8]MCP1318296.1 5'-methylthioadenosine/S-adenosylhomocysteine nucleosidase [Halomonas sp. 707B3]MCP1329689.1 5'-methylthioadenosine/S-adenosylhomocysteine nucleosidase [Halomonas sp. R1t4]MEC7296305.1 5'-methylthioadenosine/S-